MSPARDCCAHGELTCFGRIRLLAIHNVSLTDNNAIFGYGKEPGRLRREDASGHVQYVGFINRM